MFIKKFNVERDFIGYLFGSLISSLLPLLLLPFLTNKLTVSQFGVVGLFLAIVSAFMPFIGNNVSASTERKFFDDDGLKNSGEFNGAALIIIFIMLISSASLSLIFLPYILIWIPINKYIFFIAIVCAFCISIINLRLGQWQIRRQVNKYVFLQISFSSTIVLMSLILLYLSNLNIYSRILPQLLAGCIFALIALIYLYKDNILRFKNIQKKYFAEIISYSFPLIPHSVAVFILGFFDKFWISKELGIESVGIFMLAAQLTLIISLIHESLNKAFLPWLFNKLSNDSILTKKRVVKYTYLWYLINLLIIPLFFIIPPLVIPIIFGQDYIISGYLFGWLALGHTFGGMYAMQNCYLYYSKKTSILSLISIFSALMHIILLILFTKTHGIYGPGYAFCITMFLRFLLTWFVGYRFVKMPWLKII